MSTILPGLPEPGEVPPFFRGYAGLAVAFPDAAGKLETQRQQVIELLRSLTAAQRVHRYAPGKWSIQEMLGHLIDAERIFAYRALRIGRGDATPLSPFDENDYVAAAESERVPWDDLVDEFDAVRRSTILMLRGMPHSAWTRMGVSSGLPISTRALAFVMIGHVEHHLNILRERYL